MSCVYTYNGVNYSYAELAAALHGGLLEKLVADGVVDSEVKVEPDNTTEEVRVEPDVQSGIEQVKTGWRNAYNIADPYTKSDILRSVAEIGSESELLDILDLLVKGSPNESNIAWEVATRTNKKETFEKAVENKALRKSTSDENINYLRNKKFGGEQGKKEIDELTTNENKQDATKIESAESVDVGEPSQNGEEVGEGNAEENIAQKSEEAKEEVEIQEPDKTKQVKERFYKHVEGEYVEVKKAKPTYLFGTEKAFYTKEGNEYVVSDALTGAEIGRSKNASQAILNAEQNAGSVENLQKARERFYEAYGKSPYAQLQEQITFTQSLVNDAIGIGDSNMEDLENKGIIKKECE